MRRCSVKMLRSRSLLFAAAFVLIFSVGCTSASASSKPIVLFGNGIETVHFGQTEKTAISNLEKVLGKPTTSVRKTNICNVDAFLDWPTMTAYFFHRLFVGYSTSRPNRGFPKSANIMMAKGLRIGDTLAEARRTYGRDFRTSLAQGGSWFARTPSGMIDGFLTDEANRPDARIGTIEAGSVGCPALSP